MAGWRISRGCWVGWNDAIVGSWRKHRGEAHPYGSSTYWAVLNGMRTGCGMRRGPG